MKYPKLFLQSLLQDSHLDETIIKDIQIRFGINPADYTPQLAQAEALVFYQNKPSEDAYVASVLKRVATEKHGKLVYFPRHVLTISRAVFPKDIIEYDATLLEGYNSATKLIYTEGSSIEDFADNLFHLQRFYLSSIPAYGQPSTVNQFEFLKSRAAYAQCLATSTNAEQPFRLVCGDLSGIQSFIFDTHSSKAYKSLKGRSFYLQLVVETLIARLLQDTSMTSANVVYSSGGKFYLLLPNTEGVEKVIEDIDDKVQATLFESFQLGLYVCLGSVGFGINQYYGIVTDTKQAEGSSIDAMNDLWAAVSEQAASKKSSKYKSLLVNKFDELFKGELKNEDYNGEGMTTCAVLGIPIKESKENNIGDADKPIYVHESVREQTELGEKLQRNTVLIMDKEGIEPLNLGFHYDLQELIDNYKQGQATLLNPKSEDDYLKFIKNYKSTRFLFYGGNEQASSKVDSTKLADLEEIAKPVDNKTLNKIGVVKMDVDNLGSHFTNQKGEDSTLAAMSDLSARLDWFFSGYLNTLRNNDTFKDSVNIIYSGGDDLCAVGRWDAVLDFASQVREDFRQYIGNTEGVNISAGYALFSPKFPIAKAIAEAEDNLQEAKKFKLVALDKSKVINKSDKANKNAIHLLGVSVNWQFKEENEREWKFVQDLQSLFIKWLDEDIITKGTIYKLFVFKENKDRRQLDWRWQSAYYFAKMNKTELNPLRDAMITNEFKHPEASGRFGDRMFDLIILAAKLADYHSRKINLFNH